MSVRLHATAGEAPDQTAPTVRGTLDALWTRSARPEILDPDVAARAGDVAALMSGSTAARWATLTQPVIALTQPGVSATWITKAAGFDARSFCTKQIRPFVADLGSLLGPSNDPYVSNPLRFDRFEDTPAVTDKHKDRDEWRRLVAYTAWIDTLTPVQVADLVVLVLRELRGQLAARTAHLDALRRTPETAPTAAALANVLTGYIRSARSGGRRAQFAVAALAAVGGHDSVRTNSVNAADTQSANVADVDCLTDGQVVLAYEVKDIAVAPAQIREKVRALAPRLADGSALALVVLTTVPPAPELAAEAVEAAGFGIDLACVDLFEWLRVTLAETPPQARAGVLPGLAALMAAHGREEDIADLAAAARALDAVALPAAA